MCHSSELELYVGLIVRYHIELESNMREGKGVNSMKGYILSRDKVTIDEFWIDDRIYWTL
jgi:hypothetical protein